MSEKLLPDDGYGFIPELEICDECGRIIDPDCVVLYRCICKQEHNDD